MIVGLQTMGQRIYVSDVQESVLFVRYKQHENQLIIFADDTHQRFCTATCILDFETVATGDKFGNVAVVSDVFEICFFPGSENVTWILIITGSFLSYYCGNSAGNPSPITGILGLNFLGQLMRPNALCEKVLIENLNNFFICSCDFRPALVMKFRKIRQESVHSGTKDCSTGHRKR